MPDRDQCREIVRQLWPFLDGALPDEWRERVASHLEACADCRSHFDYERAFLDAIRGSAEDEGEFEPLRARVVAALTAAGMNSE
jgi:anti-sigma factor (TIGR02949 family)